MIRPRCFGQLRWGRRNRREDAPDKPQKPCLGFYRAKWLHLKFKYPFFETISGDKVKAFEPGLFVMPIECTFSLNNKPMSVLHCEGVGDFAAFSGKGEMKNDPTAVAVPNIGPLPRGRYYIVERGSGGLFTRLNDRVADTINQTERRKWFALYREDGDVDDWTFISGVRRGLFRLHPHGASNVSQGCITLADVPAFYRLRNRLLRATPIAIPGGKGFAYGTVKVQ